MNTDVFIVLFRGINVGGNKVAKMQTLRAALDKAGFGDVATYIQSGNVVLTSEKTASGVADGVETMFSETFGFFARVSVRTAREWRRLVDDNPFPQAAEDPRRLHAVLLDGMPAADVAERLRDKATATERFVIGEGVLYLFTPDGFGTSKLAEALDRLVKVPLTARNWRTVLTLMQMADKAAR